MAGDKATNTRLGGYRFQRFEVMPYEVTAVRASNASEAAGVPFGPGPAALAVLVAF